MPVAHHSFFDPQEDPALLDWIEITAVLVDACVNQVFKGDDGLRAATSLYVQTAGEYLWEYCDGVDVAWHRFDPDEWLAIMRELPCWTDKHDALAVPTLLAFFIWMIDNGHMSKELSRPLMSAMSVHARQSFERTFFQNIPPAPDSARSLN